MLIECPLGIFSFLPFFFFFLSCTTVNFPGTHLLVINLHFSQPMIFLGSVLGFTWKWGPLSWEKGSQNLAVRGKICFKTDAAWLVLGAWQLAWVLSHPFCHSSVHPDLLRSESSCLMCRELHWALHPNLGGPGSPCHSVLDNPQASHRRAGDPGPCGPSGCGRYSPLMPRRLLSGKWYQFIVTQSISLPGLCKLSSIIPKPGTLTSVCWPNECFYSPFSWTHVFREQTELATVLVS